MAFRASSRKTTYDLLPVEERPEVHAIKIRALPKFVFLYPTFLATLAMIVISAWFPGIEQHATWIYLFIMFINFQAIGLDIPTPSAFAIVSSIAAVVFALMWMGVEVGRVRVVGEWFHPLAATDFYIVLAIGMAAVFAQIFLVSIRLDYWVIMSNQIVHHHGFRDRVDRRPAPGGAVQKDINDALEFLLLRSGRLVIYPTNGEDIILENVPKINIVERQLSEMLEAMSTRIVPEHHRHDEM